jgi:rfaE bifunctional protein kinase chain/domain
MLNLLSHFADTRILVIGDVVLDHFVWGDVDRISPEAPVPVVRVKDEHDMPGAAANVALNLAALNAASYILGIVGEDNDGTRLRTLLEEHNVDCSYLLSDTETHTTRKTRIIARSQHVVRVDWDALLEPSTHKRCAVLDTLKNAAEKFDAIVLQDYHKGLITQDICDFLGTLDIPVVVDPNRYSDLRYHGSVATPNLEEAAVLSGIAIPQPKSLLLRLEAIAEGFFKRHSLEHLVITLSEHGIALCEPDGSVRIQPAAATHDVFDVSGAGDTVAAVIAAACAAGTDLWNACHIANVAGGIVVGKMGTATISLEELSAAVAHVPLPH